MGSLLARIAPNSTLSQLYPPTSKFDPERDMPDLSGKVVLVTGGNTGIGFHTVKQLLLKNATVYLAARSPKKAKEAIEMLQKDTGKTAIFLELDLADLASVRRAAEAFLSQESQLDILFNNGGVMVTPPEQLTAQNQDLQFGTNVTGHYFFTELLLPALTSSYEATKVPARIINTSSDGHKQACAGTGIDFVSLIGGPARDAWLKKLSPSAAGWHVVSLLSTLRELTGFLCCRRLYGESKLGNILVSNYFSKKYPGVLVSCALHPGSVRTELQKHLPGLTQRMLDIALPPPPMGAYTQLWAGTTATPEEINGQYLIPWARVGKAEAIASSSKLEEETIEWLKEQVKGY
ncbi:Short-chain dehydrogenase/reductase family protein [Mycena sanguinolenta]|uniref:Short-chain dehydrogenase/reductase family protein n=1 Tax=Mycena sanguinolenta TaxID=230812 RepID=A0A8H6YZ90_9AGAR|nr:Short-chain dehydrogenase/reductase family protein [Mycena sanguinolenta]